MTLLTNLELEKQLNGPAPLVKGLKGEIRANAIDSPLEAASVRLSVGKIYQLAKRSNCNELVEMRGEVVIRQGGLAFVLTEEEMCFDASHAGIMTAKSGGIADRGILITNTGHVDPGYKGHLRYLVINMGNDEFCLRRGDIITKLMIFKVKTPSNPDWSEMHAPSIELNSDTVRIIGHDFLDIERRAEEIAEKKTKQIISEYMLNYGVPALLLSMAITLAVGVMGGVFSLWAASVGGK